MSCSRSSCGDVDRGLDVPIYHKGEKEKMRPDRELVFVDEAACGGARVSHSPFATAVG